MGFKRYLSWYDAIYGYPSNRFSINYNISKNSIVVARGNVPITLARLIYLRYNSSN